MKLVKWIAALTFAGTVACGWMAAVRESSGRREQAASLIRAGDEAAEWGLYEEAGEYYTQALEFRRSEELFEKQIGAYTAFCDEETERRDSARRTLLELLDQARREYPAHVDFARQEIDLYLEREEYAEAKSVCEKALETSSNNEDLREIRWEILTSCTVGSRSYADYTEAVQGFYSVFDGRSWHRLSSDGETETEEEYDLLGSTNGEGIYYAQEAEQKGRFYDGEGVVRGKITGTYRSVGMLSEEGLCPAEKKTGEWIYINRYGQEILGPYAEAGNFTNERAVVRGEDERWYLMDAGGIRVKDEGFAKVKFGPGKGALCEGVMAASETGETWALYDEEGEPIGDFSCEDLDAPTEDGILAFCQDGKWGFVDRTGRVIWEPVYEEARSFRNGLAAVRSGDLWGFIREDGTPVTEMLYEEVGYVTDAGTVMVDDGEGEWHLLTWEFFDEMVCE